MFQFNIDTAGVATQRTREWLEREAGARVTEDSGQKARGERAPGLVEGLHAGRVGISH